jgi:hypothetical protein
MKDRFLKVEGGYFIKDSKTSALLTVNKNVLMQNEARKKIGGRIKDNGEEINNLKAKMHEMTDDITQIKNMLKILIEKKE